MGPCGDTGCQECPHLGIPVPGLGAMSCRLPQVPPVNTGEAQVHRVGRAQGSTNWMLSHCSFPGETRASLRTRVSEPLQVPSHLGTQGPEPAPSHGTACLQPAAFLGLGGPVLPRCRRGPCLSPRAAGRVRRRAACQSPALGRDLPNRPGVCSSLYGLPAQSPSPPSPAVPAPSTASS